MPVLVENKWVIDVNEFEVLNVTEMQEDEGNNTPFTISWKDLPEHQDVYIMAKRSNLKDPKFRFHMQFSFEINTVTSPFFLSMIDLWISFIIINSFFASIFLLHQYKFIHIRIPKPLRRGWFKDYISPEEKQAIIDERIR